LRAIRHRADELPRCRPAKRLAQHELEKLIEVVKRALIFAAIPLLHRFSPLAAPLVFSITAYVIIFLDCLLLGIGIAMQFYYLVIAALLILFLGSEHTILFCHDRQPAQEARRDCDRG
jgi:hypothetical protein